MLPGLLFLINLFGTDLIHFEGRAWGNACHWWQPAAGVVVCRTWWWHAHMCFLQGMFHDRGLVLVLVHIKQQPPWLGSFFCKIFGCTDGSYWSLCKKSHWKCFCDNTLLLIVDDQVTTMLKNGQLCLYLRCKWSNDLQWVSMASFTMQCWIVCWFISMMVIQWCTYECFWTHQLTIETTKIMLPSLLPLLFLNIFFTHALCKKGSVKSGGGW